MELRDEKKFPFFFFGGIVCGGGGGGGGGGGRRISLIRGRDLRKIFYGAKHTNFPLSNADLLYLPRTRTNICEATAGRGWPGPAPGEAGLDQARNGTQWASLLTTVSFSFPFLHACLSRAPLDVEGLFALPAAQISWTISLSNRLRL